MKDGIGNFRRRFVRHGAGHFGVFYAATLLVAAGACTSKTGGIWAGIGGGLGDGGIVGIGDGGIIGTGTGTGLGSGFSCDSLQPTSGGAVSLSAPTAVAGVAFTSQLVLADVNGDQKLDMGLFGSPGQQVAVALGNGDGTFGMFSQFTAGATAVGSIVIGDINNDMKADIVVGDRGSSAGPNDVYVLLGKGDGTFGAATRFSASTGAILLLKLGDLNSDGLADVMVIDHTTNDLITLLSKSDGTLEAPLHTSLPGAETVLAPGDINNLMAVPRSGSSTQSNMDHTP